jgi:hypothetical protein
MNSKATFRFKITKSRDNNGRSMVFGICNNNFDLGKLIGRIGQSWGFYRYNGKKMHRSTWDTADDYARVNNDGAQGEIISLTLDTSLGELSFGINDEYFGVAFKSNNLI